MVKPPIINKDIDARITEIDAKLEPSVQVLLQSEVSALHLERAFLAYHRKAHWTTRAKVARTWEAR